MTVRPFILSAIAAAAGAGGIVAASHTALQSFLASYPPQTLASIRAGAPTKQQRIGANTVGVQPWSITLTFCDLMRHGAYWSNPNGSLGSGAPVDNGTGNQSVATGPDNQPVDSYKVMLLNQQPASTRQIGTYTVAYQGAGTLYLTTNVGTFTATSTAVANGWTVLSIPVGSNYSHLEVRVNFTKVDGVAVDPVKNVRVLLPGYTFNPADPDSTPIFTTEYCDHLRRFSCLRFMDFLRTNTEPSAATEKPEGVWSARPTPANKRTSQTGPVGQPWEWVVAMCNEVEADAWINVPARANDAYFASLGAFMRDNLSSNLKVYIEYGNEMWNSQFIQATDLKNEALDLAAAGSAGEGARINYDGVYAGPRTLYEKGVILTRRLYVDRLVRIIQAFQTAFGVSGASRVRGVMTWQVVDPAAYEAMLEYVQLQYGAPSNFFYATSGAPYFGLTSAAKSAAAAGTLTVTGCLDAMDEDSIYHIRLAQYEAHIAMAKRWSVKFIAYEGGPDTFGGDAIAIKASASRSDRMFEICRDHLNRWAIGGGELFMWFTAGAGNWNTPYGTWSLVEDIIDITGPKTSAMDWASITMAPQPASRHALKVAGISGAATTGGTVFIGENIRPGDPLAELYDRKTYVEVWINNNGGRVKHYSVSTPVDHAFTFSLNVNPAGSPGSWVNMPIEILVNGLVSPIAFVTPTGSGARKVTGSVPLNLSAGINAISIRHTQPEGDGYYVICDYMTFE